MSKVTAPSKIHASKDASNVCLKKLGIIQPDYALFQEKTADGKWETFTEEAEAHVVKLAEEEAKAVAKASSKAKAKPVKVKTPKAVKEPKEDAEPRHNPSQTIRHGIIDGLTKVQILGAVAEAFPEIWTEEKCKKDGWFVSWHRHDLERKGMLEKGYKLPK
jgi:hypothetical protein